MRNLTIWIVIAAMSLAAILGPGPLALGPVQVAEANPGTQWNAQYFNNNSLSGGPVVSRIDDRIDFNWAGGSPDPAVPADNFSARWTKTVNFPTAGKWTFRVGADDGVRLWIDVTPLVDEWHGNPEGYRTYEVSIDQLTAGNHDLKVEYYEASGNAGIKVEWWYSSGGAPGGGAGAVYGPATWNASYYNSLDLSAAPTLTRVDGDVNFNWGTGSPGGGVNADNFSARWTTTVNIPETGHWRFQVGADDGVRMWIDVTQILNEWHGNPEGYRTYDADVYALTAGNHDLKVEYYEATGEARILVRWFMVSGTGAGGGGALAPVAPPPPPAVVKAGVTGYRVNVRTGPGRGYPAITQVFYPTNYLVLGGVPDLSWLLIDLGDGSEGWVSNDWVYLFSTDAAKNKDTTGGGQPDFVDDIPRLTVEMAPPALPPDGPPRRFLQGQATDTVRMRDGASLYASKIIASLPLGATFEVEARNRNGAWYLVDYQGIRGWVSAPYVRLLDGTESELVVSAEIVPVPPLGAVFVPGAEAGAAVTVRGVATANLIVRDAASTQGAEIGRIEPGTEFVVLGRNTTGAWYLIPFEGGQGWVYSPFVTLIEGRVPDLPIR